MSSGTKSFIGGMSVLGITGIVCKLVGVLYSIPLANILGDNGLGMFQTVFPTYNLLLTLSSAGLPVAISSLVSHHLAKDDPRNAKRIFRLALTMLGSLGVFFTVMMLICNGLLTDLVGVSEAADGFRVIAPCVAIVCVLAAFRGFFQGQQNMVPTAISQIIEQCGKVVISLPLAAIGMRTSVAAGAAGALLGITCVELIACVYIMVLYALRRKSFNTIRQLSDAPLLSNGRISRDLLTIAIPITITACIIPLAQFIDSALMVKRMMVSGLDKETATSLYGIFSGMVIRLINIPTALAQSISMSLVPAVAAAKALENEKGIRYQSSTGIRFAFLIGFPCAIGMSVLAKEILGFFYVETLTPERLQTASELLTFSALTVVLFTVVQATSSILQGLHKPKIPMYTMIAGVTCKVVLNYFLIAIPGLNIHGGPYASIVCYTVVMVPNLYLCCRYAHMPFDWKGWIIRPGAAVIAMGCVIFAMKRFLPFGRIQTILEIVTGAAVYIAVALAVKAFTADDLRSFRRKKRRQAQ